MLPIVRSRVAYSDLLRPDLAPDLINYDHAFHKMLLGYYIDIELGVILRRATNTVYPLLSTRAKYPTLD